MLAIIFIIVILHINKLGFIIFHRYNPRYGLELGCQKRSIYHGHFVSSDQSEMVFFVSPTVINHIASEGSIKLAIDSTFKVVPRIGRLTQLLNIQVLYQNMVSFCL